MRNLFPLPLHIVRLMALVCLLVGLLWLLLARAGTVQAAGTVTDCSNDTDLNAKLGGGGLVTFNCALPAPIIITVTTSGGIVPAPDTTLDGSNSGNSITLSGGGGTRLFHHLVASGTLTLTHLTLREGNAGSGNGGCLYNEGGTVVLVDVTVTHCKVAANYSGGGMYNNGGGLLTLIDSRVISNTAASSGGGIYNGSFSTATLLNSTLSDNAAPNDGGGIDNEGTVTLDHITLNGNSAGYGGGIFNDSSSAATLNNSTLSGNSASVQGGGIFNIGTATLNNSTLSGNLASYDGGGITNNGRATLNNSTLSGNSASSAGGGIQNVFDVRLLNVTLSNNSAPTGGALYMVSGYTTMLTNTVVAYSNSPADGNCNGPVSASISSISSDNTCALTGTVNGMNPNGLDPLLSALGNYGGPMLVHMLMLGSPAIDGVVGNPILTTDQRGLLRSQDGFYDIGAVERQPTDSDLPPRLYLPLIER